MARGILRSAISVVALLCLAHCAVMKNYEEVLGPKRTANRMTNVDSVLSKDEALEDIDFLFDTMEHVHPRLYESRSKDEVREEILAAEDSMEAALSIRDLYLGIAPIVASFGYDHTFVQFPWDAYNDYLYSRGGKTFPLDVYFDGEDIRVKYSGSTQNVSPGSRMQSINGIPSAAVVSKLLEYCQGSTYYSRINKRLPMYFSALLWLVYGFGDTFSLVIDGQAVSINGETADTIRRIKAVRYGEPANNADFSYRIVGRQTGCLVINSFGQNGFEDKLKNAFSRISADSITDLIIDVRLNTGGSTDQVEVLIGYIWGKAFRTMSRIEQKRSAEMDAFLNEMFAWWVHPFLFFHPLMNAYFQTPVGEVAVIEMAEKNPADNPLRFKGRVYVLTGPVNYSSGTEFVSAVKDYRMGIILGTPTGSSANEYGNAYEFMLPNSRIWVSCATNFSIRPSGERTMGGIEPDMTVHDAPIGALPQRDAVLEYALNLVNARRDGVE